MPKPICNKCKYHHEETFVDRKSKSLGKVDVCLHEECRHIINGNHIPCEQARMMPEFCGMEGKYFEEKDNAVSLFSTNPGSREATGKDTA